MNSPEFARTGLRIVGLCTVVWPTLYIIHQHGGNLSINPNGGNLAVTRDVTKQAVEDAMKPRFDDLAKKIDDGLAKIDADVKGLKKEFKKTKQDVDDVRGLSVSTRIELDLLMKKQKVPPFTNEERNKHIKEIMEAGKIISPSHDDDDEE